VRLPSSQKRDRLASHVNIGTSVLEEHALSFSGMKSYLKYTGGYFNQAMMTIFGHMEKEHRKVEKLNEGLHNLCFKFSRQVMQSIRVRGWSR